MRNGQWPHRPESKGLINQLAMTAFSASLLHLLDECFHIRQIRYVIQTRWPVESDDPIDLLLCRFLRFRICHEQEDDALQNCRRRIRALQQGASEVSENNLRLFNSGDVQVIHEP